MDQVGSPHLAEALRSGWGALLKPAAYSGLLCNGPSSGNRVTFTSPSSWLPDWRPVPPHEAGPELVRRYLAAYGPATRDDVGNWLRRGVKVSTTRAWFAALGDELATVDVDGAPASVLAEHLDELLVTTPVGGVRMLGAFDQYVIAVDRSLIPAEHLAKASRTAGWISPVVLHQGRVAGVWNLDGAGRLAVELFEKVPRRALAAEAKRLCTTRRHREPRRGQLNRR